MTKPRFTPDPLPDGLDPELSSFLQRQFDRINDWWPKDLEDRVKALEENYGYITGTWPIVDYSYVQFEGAAEAAQLLEQKFALFNISSFALADTYVGFDPVDLDIIPERTGTLLHGASNDLGETIIRDGDNLLRTTDFENWLSVSGDTDLGFMVGQTIFYVAYSDGEWICIGRPSDAASTTRGFKVMVSTDGGETWAQRYKDTTTHAGGVFATDGNGTLALGSSVASPRSSYVLWSDDNGATWNTSTMLPNSTSTGRTIAGVSYANGIWYGLGNAKTLWTSTDLVNWTLRITALGNPQTFVSVIHGGGRWVAVVSGVPGDFFTSEDGLGWTDRGALFTASSGSLVYDDDLKWALVSGNQFSSSSDGLTWGNVDTDPWASLQFIMKVVKEV